VAFDHCGWQVRDVFVEIARNPEAGVRGISVAAGLTERTSGAG